MVRLGKYPSLGFEINKAQLSVLRQILLCFVLFKAFFTCIVVVAHVVLSLEVKSHVVLVPCCIRT